jgi:hypothetical protein
MMTRGELIQIIKETHATSTRSLSRCYKSLIREGRISASTGQEHLDQVFVQKLAIGGNIEAMDFIVGDECRPRRKDLVDLLGHD